MAIRVLLCDDHQLLRENVRKLFSGHNDIELVAEAADGEVAVAYAEQFKPDVVILNMSLPRLNGTQATERIKQCCPDARVLALNLHAGRNLVQPLFDDGSSGFSLKSAAGNELLNAIRAVSQGQLHVDSSLTYLVLPRQGRVDESHENNPARPSLSEREEQVARLLAQGFTNKEIALKLEVSVKTIETYKSRAMEKIGVQTRAQLVRHALRRGWLDEEMSESSVV